MTKTELIKKVAVKAEMDNKEAGKAVLAVTEVIKEALASGESVDITGFGKFEVRERAAREGRNPATGEKMMCKASKNVGFKAGKALKDALN